MITDQYLKAIEANTDQLQRAVLRQLIPHIGPSKPVTGDELCALLGKDPKKFKRTLRLAIKALVEDHRIPVCFKSGSGYYLAGSIHDARSAAAELRSRAKDEFKRADALMESASEIFGRQESMLLTEVI